MAVEAHESSRALWDEMAQGWDRNRDYMWDTTRAVAEWLVDEVEPKPGDTILDVAGGTGEIGFLAAERVGSAGKVVVTDFAPRMVEAASRAASERSLGNVETRVLDAQQMDFGDDTFDGIVCRWGFMLMVDPQAALEECRRVLKGGRRLAFSVWGAPEKNPWVTVTGMTMIQMGHQPGGDPFGPGGMFSMADHDVIRSLVTNAGFEEVTIEEMPVDWSHASFEDAWGFMTEVAGAIAAVVKQLPPREVDKLRATLEDNLQPFRTGSGITVPGVTINVVAS